MARILVIDSDTGVRAMLVRALEPLAEVEQTGSGIDALRLLAAHKYALVILDLNVRPIDGFVILRTLGAKPGPNKRTPMYVLTSDPSEQARLKAMSEHALFVLSKPVSISTVVTLVDAGLKKAAASPPVEGASSSRPPPGVTSPRQPSSPPGSPPSTSPPERPPPDKPAA